jgi:hypothetical protein
MATARAQGGLRESDGWRFYFFFSIFLGPWETSTFLRDLFDGPPYYFSGARAKKIQKGQGLAPGNRVSHRMGGMQNELRLGHLLQDLPGLVSVRTWFPTPHRVHHDNR